jgi:hypothetical protein
MNGRRWTYAEVSRLRDLIERGASTFTAAAALGRSRHSVWQRAWRSGFWWHTTQFTPEEISAVRRMAARLVPATAMARELGRTRAAIHALLRRIRFRREPTKRIAVAVTCSTHDRLAAYGRRFAMPVARTAAVVLEHAARDIGFDQIVGLTAEVNAPRLGACVAAPELCASIG